MNVLGKLRRIACSLKVFDVQLQLKTLKNGKCTKEN